MGARTGWRGGGRGYKRGHMQLPPGILKYAALPTTLAIFTLICLKRAKTLNSLLAPLARRKRVDFCKCWWFCPIWKNSAGAHVWPLHRTRVYELPLRGYAGTWLVGTEKGHTASDQRTNLFHRPVRRVRCRCIQANGTLQHTAHTSSIKNIRNCQILNIHTDCSGEEDLTEFFPIPHV